MTGWRFIAEECARVGVVVRLAEPAETRMRQDRKRRAKTDKLDARLLRELLMQERLPESWIAPEHILDLRAKVRLRKTLVDQRTEWLQRIHAVLFHHGVPVSSGRLRRLEGRHAREQLARLDLPGAAQQQITIALGIIEHLNGELHGLDLELERFARRQPGCRALMDHYGMSTSGDSDRCRARRRPAVLFLRPGSALRGTRRHRPRVRPAPPRRAPIPAGFAGAALGCLRGRPVRGAPGLTRPRLLPAGQRPHRSKPRCPDGRAQAAAPLPPHPARTRRRRDRPGPLNQWRALPDVT